jgi:hypothetical protein
MTWSQISGGFAQVALEHLTGRAAEQLEFQTADHGRNQQGQTWASSSVALQSWLKTADPTNARFMAWFANGESTAFELALVKLHEDHDEVRKDEVFPLLDAHVLDPVLRQDVKNFIDNAKLYPGRRGSGEDTADQISLFTSVAQALAAHKHVVLSSKESMKRRGGANTGKSAGEHKYEGLAGPHAYEVVDFRPADFVQNPRPGVLLWLKVRNPWGEYGRKYQDAGQDIAGGDPTLRPQGMHAVKTDEGEFWIPLADVTKRFRKVTTQ